MDVGIYVDREPPNDDTPLTGFIVYFLHGTPMHKTIPLGPYRVSKFTSCTLRFIKEHASGIGLEDPTVYVVNAHDTPNGWGLITA